MKIKTQIFFLLIAVCVGTIKPAHAQDKPYFQQEVNYQIEVTLDDQNHTLTGTIEMSYTNHSPDALTFIYIHLWPNAYQPQTALAEQFVASGSLEMYNAADEDLGAITDLNFTVDGTAASWDYDPNHKDIAIVRLTKPLLTGSSVKIFTPFKVTIPASFSRLGHVEESYQMTQWYPKPAVYDRFGWHPMPYLNMGEFYSEFGNFDVKITLPKNYVVGATGELQTPSEIDFLNQKAAETAALDTFEKTSPFPPSDSTMKTLHYTAERVHDFAWFADKRFHVLKSQVELPSGKKVDTWAMFTNYQASLWKEAPSYINRAVAYYSERVGEYPYPHATAVQSALSAGAGMEYPMITVIGGSGSAYDLDLVITHEVGHNWFYGILASNERDHAWMDEGMNSYYENEYMNKFWGGGEFMEAMLPDAAWRFLDAEGLKTDRFLYLWQARERRQQAMNTTSSELTLINYQLSAYTIPAFMFKYLETYFGTETYDRIIHQYFDTWKFRHPYPKDVQNLFEQASGKDLSWFFEAFFTNNQTIDYALKNVQTDEGGKTLVTVANRGQIAAPVVITAMQNDTASVLASHWLEGFDGEKTVELPTLTDGFYRIDGEGIMPDIRPSNNRLNHRTNLKFLAGIENPAKKTLYFTPLVSWNRYDGLMLGLGLYNSVIPAKNFEFQLAPMYGFSSSDLVGLADAQYTFYSQRKIFRKIEIGVGARRFNSFGTKAHPYELRYTVLKPRVEAEFKRQENSSVRQTINLNARFMSEESAVFDNTGNFLEKATSERTVYQATYQFKNKRTLHPYDVTVSLLNENYNNAFGNPESYVKATLEAHYEITFPKKKGKSFDIRLFAGKFLTNSDPDFGPFPFPLTSMAYNDYYFDDFYFGRSQQTNIWSQQISLANGGFKTPLPSAIQNGSSNDLIVAVNLKTDLPMKLPLRLPIKPYLDLGYFKETAPSATDPVEFFYNFGVMLDVGDGMFGIYFPIAGTESLMNQLASRGNYWNRISFSLDLNRINPWELLRDISIKM